MNLDRALLKPVGALPRSEPAASVGREIPYWVSLTPPPWLIFPRVEEAPRLTVTP